MSSSGSLTAGEEGLRRRRAYTDAHGGRWVRVAPVDHRRDATAPPDRLHASGAIRSPRRAVVSPDPYRHWRWWARHAAHHRERAILRLRACALADRFASADSRGCSGVKCVAAPSHLCRSTSTQTTCAPRFETTPCKGLFVSVREPNGVKYPNAIQSMMVEAMRLSAFNATKIHKRHLGRPVIFTAPWPHRSRISTTIPPFSRLHVATVRSRCAFVCIDLVAQLDCSTFF